MPPYIFFIHDVATAIYARITRSLDDAAVSADMNTTISFDIGHAAAAHDSLLSPPCSARAAFSSIYSPYHASLSLKPRCHRRRRATKSRAHRAFIYIRHAFLLRLLPARQARRFSISRPVSSPACCGRIFSLHFPLLTPGQLAACADTTSRHSSRTLHYRRRRFPAIALALFLLSASRR